MGAIGGMGLMGGNVCVLEPESWCYCHEHDSMYLDCFISEGNI